MLCQKQIVISKEMVYKGDGLKQGLLHWAVSSTHSVTDFLLDIIGTHHRQLDLSHDTFPVRVPEKYTTVN